MHGLILRHADKIDELYVSMLGEERVCGVGENKIDQNGSTDHKGDRHTKEDGQHG